MPSAAHPSSLVSGRRRPERTFPSQGVPPDHPHVLAPTVEAGAAPMQALLGEPGEGIGSPDGSPRRDDQAQHEADEG